MKNFLNQMFSSGGKVSSKRVVTIVAFILLGIAFLVDLFTNLVISENILPKKEEDLG